VALLAINNSRTESSAIDLDASSERYTLAGADLQSGDVTLNGEPLQLGPNDALPSMAGSSLRQGRIRFDPATITFLAIPAADNPRCPRR